MGYERFHILDLGLHNNRLTCMQGQKNTLIFLQYAFYFTLIAQRLPNDSVNDSFFQTPPLHHANQR